MPPLVSVCVSTYRQEPFIAECIESIVSQQTDFDFEIVVADDCSPDGTRDVLRALEKKHPNRLRLLLAATNGGPFANYLAVHSAARGKYVAHVDGDDFLLPGKLQRQVDYMEANPDCNVCWHRMLFVAGSRTQEHPARNPEFEERELRREELCALGAFGAHSSTMYRRENFDRTMLYRKSDDWLMALVYMREGYAWLLPEVLAGYRILENSMSSGARPTRANRRLSTDSQLQALELFPGTGPFIALRAWANFLLDAAHLRGYAWLHLRVVLRCGVVPALRYLPRLYRFYRWGRFPAALR